MALGYGRVSTNNFATAKFIVDANGISAGATHSTIAAALADASSGDTIFVRPGTYTEDLTLVAGVNITGSDTLNGQSGTTPNTKIVGKCTFTDAGAVNISNIGLVTNSDYCVENTGTAASYVTLNNCYILATDNTALNLSSTLGVLEVLYCIGDVQDTGITVCANSSATSGRIRFMYTTFWNSGNSVTASAATNAADISMNWCAFHTPFSFADTSRLNCGGSVINVGGVVAVTTSSTTELGIRNTRIVSADTTNAIFIDTGAHISLFFVDIFANGSTYAVNGSGTYEIGGVTYEGTTTVNGVSQIDNSVYPIPDAGITVQQVRASTASVITCNTAIPFVDTIPQNDEGTEVLTVTITPTSASNILVIEFVGWWYRAASNATQAALFQDTTAGALAAVNASSSGAAGAGTTNLVYTMTAGTGSSTTFKIRSGAADTTAIYYNGTAAGARLYGGVGIASLIVTEVEP